VQQALKDGRLARLPFCQECFSYCVPDAHHADYDRPLDVEWLCKRCHRRKREDDWDDLARVIA